MESSWKRSSLGESVGVSHHLLVCLGADGAACWMILRVSGMWFRTSGGGFLLVFFCWVGGSDGRSNLVNVWPVGEVQVSGFAVLRDPGGCTVVLVVFLVEVVGFS